ncbi:MAG: creatinine amidohydrolase, partial [Hungatella hathewayi]|nr:creatinine amidohydrolase [Hungatella hathewayi]
MRTRILPRMLNDEVEAYLTRGDVIIVPVGTVELHGGLPLDSETVIS